MKILLCGAGGRLANVLESVLTRHEVVTKSHSQLDIAEGESVRDVVGSVRPQIVINAAAYNNVDGAEENSGIAFRSNAQGPLNLARATAEMKAVLVHLSTDYVFDGDLGRPYHEIDHPNPLSVYAQSKRKGEEFVIATNPRHFVIRTAWLYHTRGANFLKAMLTQSDKPSLKVIHDQFGSPTFIPHLAEAISKLMESEAYGIYHLAGRGGASWYEWCEYFFRLMKIQTQLLPISSQEFPRVAKRPRTSVLTTIKDPPVLLPPWQQGVEEFVRALGDCHPREGGGPDT